MKRSKLHLGLVLCVLVVSLLGLESWAGTDSAEAPQEKVATTLEKAAPAVAKTEGQPEVSALEAGKVELAKQQDAVQPFGEKVNASGPVIGPAGPIRCNCTVGSPSICPNNLSCQACPCLTSATSPLNGVCR